MIRSTSVLLVSVTLCALLPGAATARPERIRPGHSYYSDEQVTRGRVRDIAGEKNYEEVYQSYRYYESVYDEEERVVVFKEYVRGDLVRTEEYRYGDAGRLRFVVIREPGRPAATIDVDAAVGEVGDSESAR